MEGGEFGAGRLLPSEADLSGAYEVSRVTVRRALEVLRDEGLVASRQGFGWFAPTDPVRQSLGRLATIEDQLVSGGVESTRQILDFAFVEASGRVRSVLGSETVLRVRRRNLADDVPFALVTVWCPDSLAADLSRADVESASFYELIDTPLGGATQTIAAVVATAEDGELLDVPAGSALLRCERITHDRNGVPVLLSEFVFPAHLTEFVVDLPHAEPSIAPTGLRLVGDESPNGAA